MKNKILISLTLLCSLFSCAQFSGLTSNQVVTELNAAGAGFTLKAGQSHGTTNLCLTKDAANIKYNLDLAAQSGYAGNQLLVKSVWLNGLLPAPINVTNVESHGNGSSYLYVGYTLSTSPLANLTTYMAIGAGQTLYSIANNSTYIPFTGLTANTSYPFTVYTRTTDGQISSGASANIGTPPESINSASFSASVASTSISLTWGVVDGASNYYWYIGETSAQGYTNSSAGYYDFTGLTPSTNYTLYIYPIGTYAWGDPSASPTYTTTAPPDTTPPSAPTGLYATDITMTSMTINWAASTDDVGIWGYEVFVNGVAYNTTTGTDLNITGLTANTSYTIEVKAYDTSYNTTMSSAIYPITGS